MRDWLKIIREKKGLSQAAVARLVGIRQSAYSMIEIGKRSPRPKTAKRLAKVLGIADWTRFYENEDL